MDWNRRGCARQGHVLYEPVEPEVQALVRADTALGTAWRCLRCGDFVLDVPTASGPAEQAPKPARGKALRSRLVMRVLAVERIFRFLLIGLGAFAVWKFSNSQHALQDLFERNLTIFKPVAQHYGYDLDNSSVVATIRKWFTYKPSTLDAAAVALGAYAVIELIEAVGLWLAKRWGEYFAAVATGLFLPVEIYELTDHATKFKIATFALNVAAVAYLVLAKRLFGLRGGGRAYEAQLTSESLLTEALAEARSELRPGQEPAAQPPVSAGSGPGFAGGAVDGQATVVVPLPAGEPLPAAQTLVEPAAPPVLPAVPAQADGGIVQA